MAAKLELIDVILNIDQYLSIYIEKYGVWIYLFLFLIIFSETGLVVMPFLPGDSLLFVVGALAAAGIMSIEILIPVLIFAAISGNTVNYHIGRFLGPKVFNGHLRLLDKEKLEKTQEFYEKHGGKAIIVSRFLPVLRTFIPFIAGVSKMNYYKFLQFNIIGGVLWVLAFTFGGYFFGNLPYIKNNFELIIIGILIVSLAPTLIEFLKHRHIGGKLSKKNS